METITICNVLFFTIFILTLGMMIIVLAPVLKNITEPITRLTKAMGTVRRKNLDITLMVNTGDEIEFLYKGFNEMIEEINRYIKEQIKNEQQKKEMEFDIMLSQINPHYLYNVLNTVIYMAAAKKCESIVLIVNSLIKMLQDSLKIGEKFIFTTVEKELELIDCYLTIQKFRYPDIFEVHILELDSQIYYFFFVPDGMEPVYSFQGDISTDNIRQTKDTTTGTTTVKQKMNVLSSFQVSNLDSSITIVTLTKEQSLDFYKTRMNEKECIVITPGGLLVSENEIRVEYGEAHINLLTFPPNLLIQNNNLDWIGSQDLFGSYILHTCEKTYGELKTVKKGFGRYTIEIPKDYLLGVKESILSIDYVGDIGHAFIDGDLIADNFCNGTSFDIGLSQFASRLRNHPLTIYITPMKQGTHINVDSVMAGRMEQTDSLIAEIRSVCIKPVYELLAF